LVSCCAYTVLVAITRRNTAGFDKSGIQVAMVPLQTPVKNWRLSKGITDGLLIVIYAPHNRLLKPTTKAIPSKVNLAS